MDLQTHLLQIKKQYLHFSLIRALRMKSGSKLWRICNGPPPGEFKPDSALEKFFEIKLRRPIQKQRKSYRPRKSEKQVETLMDIASDEEENDTERRDIDDDNEGENIDTTFDNALGWDD